MEVRFDEGSCGFVVGRWIKSGARESLGLLMVIDDADGIKSGDSGIRSLSGICEVGAWPGVVFGCGAGC